MATLWLSCSSDSAATGAFNLNGTIADASNMGLFLDKITFNNSTSVLGKVELGGNGKFNLSLDEHPGEGMYRVRLGAKKAYIILNGSENNVTLSGKLSDFDNADFGIKGSDVTQKYLEAVKDVKSGKLNINNFASFATNNDGLIGALIAANHFTTMDEKTIAAFKQAQTKLNSQYPNSSLSQEFSNLVLQKEQVLKQFLATQRIQNGKPAPDITLKDPKGKEFSLSDLKGKVVLLDFWASWCGPCRRENPNVVKLYDKYNQQGFEVFSVSLDGLDTNDKRRFKLDTEEKVQARLTQSKQKWEAAIKQDKLKWPYHVSSLSKWETEAAKDYGVRGIPKTFLIDRDGNISATGLRGHQLEPAVKALL